jgi:sulfate/thiosulfate transport system ATP-binding protein
MSIVIERLTKRFGTQLVLDGVSIEVASGEFFVLLGASGSGKSTILRVIAGLSAPDQGRVMLKGRDVTGLRPQDRGTGFVFQNYSIFQHMTVAQNIEFGLMLRKVPAPIRARRRDELLDMVGLPGFASREAARLSGGQQQRVAIARALAYEPGVLLLDEPFGALDVKIRTQLRRSFRNIQERLKITTVLVTHDQDEAFELADRIGVMDRGRLIEVGRAEDLYANPKTLFTATFLGSGTVLVGRAVGDRARFNELEFPIPPDVPHDDDSPAHLLIRPEDVLVYSEPPPPGLMTIGQGVVSVEGFASAAIRRARIRLSKFAQVHPSSSSPPDPENLVLDALIPAHVQLPESKVWVALRRWHFLNPPRPSILVCDDGRGRAAALQIARELSFKLKARLFILGVTGDAKDAAGLGARVKRRQKQAGLGHLELHVRYGNPADQILGEQAELLTRMILLAPRPVSRRWRFWGRDKVERKRLGRTILALLERTDVPVLVVDGTGIDFKRLLVMFDATIAGARFLRTSGRLARRLNAEVTLLEISGGPPVGRAREDLARDLRTPAELLEVGDAKERHALVRGGSVEETVTRLLDFPTDLVVAPLLRRGPHARNVIDPLMIELLSRVDCPVLVVPTGRGE